MKMGDNIKQSARGLVFYDDLMALSSPVDDYIYDRFLMGLLGNRGEDLRPECFPLFFSLPGASVIEL